MTLNGVYNSISWRHLAGLIYLHKKTIKYKLYIHDTRPHFTFVKPSTVSDPRGSSKLQTVSDMNFTQTLDEHSTAVNNPTTNSNLKYCFHFTSVYYETGSSKVPYIVNASLSILLSLVTTVANILVLSAIRKNTSLRLPSKLLLGSLVLTDLGVGIAVQPMFAAFLVAKVKGFSDICVLYASMRITASILTGVSLLTMMAISLDRYIALYFHLRYRDIVTTRRVFSVLVVIWLFAGLYSCLLLWKPMLWRCFFFTVASISFIVCTLSYIMIYRGLRHQQLNQVADQAQAQPQQQAANPLNVARYRRSASNMLWIYGIFVLFYLPFVLTRIAARVVGHTVSTQCLLEFSVTVMALNSCLNPFVYCYRLSEIRASVLETLHKICGQSHQQ